MRKRYLSPIVLLSFALPLSMTASTDLSQADAYYNMQNWFNAIPLYQDALKSDQGTPAVKYKLAICYLKLNYDEEATSLLKELIGRKTDISLNASKQLIRIWFGRNDFKEALAVILSARADFPNDPALYDNLLNAYENLGNYDEALKTIESSGQARDNSFARRKIGYLFKLKRAEEALSLIESGLSAGKDDAFWQEMKAGYYRNIGDLQSAEKAYTDLFKKNGDPRVIKECASMYAESGHGTDAARIITEFVVRSDRSGFNQGYGMMKELALYDSAIDLVKKMRADSSDTGYTRELIGLYELTYKYQELATEWVRYLHETSDLDLAKSRLVALATIQGQNRIVTNILSQLELRADENEKARIESILYGIDFANGNKTDATIRLLKMTALKGSVPYMLAGAEDMLKKNWNEEAQKILVSALTVTSDKNLRTQIMTRSAAADFQLRSYDSALKTLNSLETQVSLNASDSDSVSDYKSRVLFATGQYKESLDALNRVRNKNGRILLGMARCIFMLGQPDKALDFCRKARTDPGTAEDSLLLQGLIHTSIGEKPKALEDFESMIRNGATSDDAPYALGVLLLLKNVFSGTQVSPLSTGYNQVLKEEIAGHYTSAAGIFRSLSGQAGKNSFYFDYLAGLDYFKDGKWAECTISLNSVSENPSALQAFKSRALELQGDILERTGDLKSALVAYMKLITGDAQYARQVEVRMKIMEIRKKGIQ